MPAASQQPAALPYRGRIAPTPSGWLHLGHAATFSVAWQRAREARGAVILRIEDIDPARCKPEYTAGAIEDLRWWGLDWEEGPDVGGPHAPYLQSERLMPFREVFTRLRETGLVYPSPHSRAEIERSCRQRSPVDGDVIFAPELRSEPGNWAGEVPQQVNWRFRVPEGERVEFVDGRTGRHAFQAGRDFGDFIIWKKDGFPSYELAVVADDHAMQVTEAVRGEDLLLSTARQLLLYRALGWAPPAWYHCPLVEDPATGKRMSKTHQSLSLRQLRLAGLLPRQPVEAYLRNP